jgi:hypothetical protein
MTQPTEALTHPVQLGRGASGRCPQVVTLRAYEVYCAVYSPQPAMIEGPCRGGFGTGELIAFLYAHTFPRSEWAARVEEALHGMSLNR